MRVKYITFTKKNLNKTFTDPWDCPIRDACRDAGIPVSYVVSWGYKIGVILFKFSKTMVKVSDFLSMTDNKKSQRKSLIGKRFRIQIPIFGCGTALRD